MDDEIKKDDQINTDDTLNGAEENQSGSAPSTEQPKAEEAKAEQQKAEEPKAEEPKDEEPVKRQASKRDDYWRPRDSSFEPGSGRRNQNNSENNGNNGNRGQYRQNNNSGNSGNSGFSPLGSPKNKIGIGVFIAIVIAFMFTIFSSRSSAVEVTYSAFKNAVSNGVVKYVDIKDSTVIRFATEEGNEYVTRIPYEDAELLTFLESKGVTIQGSEQEISILAVLLQLLPWIFIIGFYIMLMKNASGNGQLMQFGKSHAKQFTDKDVKVKFKDVAGQKEAKYELEEVVEFLKNPKRFNEIGARIPRGVLLVGPPGTGKTLIAKAVAGEAGVSFFHTSGSDFVEMFVGMGAARVRDLFDQGRKHSPCILFIDEIDAVGRARGSGLGGGHDEREQTLNQILVEMDGFDTASGVIVIAATNRADVLDPALLRPGRFDRQVAITLPDIQEREDILKIHAAKVKMDSSVDLRRIARATPGASGADLANLVNEAALFATRAKRKAVIMEDFEQARDKMVLGVAKKSHVMNEEDKRMTAYHEGGHALLFYYLPDLDPLYKVTIIPHGNAGGVTMGLPEEDVSYYKKSKLLSHITMAMGGYVAEEILNGQTSTGPSSDIKQATDIARRMVTEWGMSDLGFVSLGSEGEPLFLGREIATHKDFSEYTAERIDKEMHRILDSCLAQARQLLNEHRDQLDLLANELMAKETLDDADIRELLGFEAAAPKNTDLS
ncbi:MAG: ATP-dependent zinc metalloprotease FtsH [Sphaerochaetaceae bacterium]|nr:ATP-dependent zinc metalloprotease FtsH [Sphaerochaetaceae bacterium]